MLSLSQRLSQQQKLSPQQIQYQKLLQLNTLALEQRIKTELEINPILEEVMEEEPPEKKEEEAETQDEFEDYDKEEFELEDFMNDRDFESKCEQKLMRNISAGYLQERASEHLREQLQMLNLDEKL
jgi:RNA polymerase sigma-54 factor